MLKKMFTIPDTFDPDDRRRRQVLNTILVVLLFMFLFGFLLTLFIICCYFDPYNPMNGKTLLAVIGSAWIVFCVLIVANRSLRVPSWLTGTILIAIFVLITTQADTPSELYNGRSTVAWAIPIVMAAVIFRPGYAFLVTVLICEMMQLFTPSNGSGLSQVNYYSMGMLIFIASVVWLGMSIAERAIHDARRQAANLQAIFNNVGEGVLVLDLAGRFLAANPALLAMIPKEEIDQILSTPLENTLRWQRKLFSINLSPVPGVGTVAVFRDETRRQEVEHAKDAVLATVSHEFRTPLTVVMNYLEMLLVLVKTPKVDTQAFGEYVARALENSQRLLHLVNNILDQAQLQAGAFTLQHQRFDLSQLLERSRQLLDTLLKQKNLSYTLHIAPDVPAELVGDPDRLHQVLVNLIGNAIKFTRQGGVRVDVSAAADQRLSIQVVDSGPGIPEERLPDIFEPFRRASDYAQREQQGAGLGLSIAREIILLMGGQITVSSALGVGSTFTISLPLDSS